MPWDCRLPGTMGYTKQLGAAGHQSVSCLGILATQVRWNIEQKSALGSQASASLILEQLLHTWFGLYFTAWPRTGI